MSLHNYLDLDYFNLIEEASTQNSTDGIISRMDPNCYFGGNIQNDTIRDCCSTTALETC